MSLTLATITVADGEPVNVHFNPASLRVTTSNQFDDNAPNQVSKPTSFKLDVELLFDTTETGADIHQVTRAIRNAAIANATGAVAHDEAGQDAAIANDKSSHLRLVTLTWGTRRYQGYIESINETLDFWSSDGVPLRATVQISLKGTTRKFIDGTYNDLKYEKDNPAPALPPLVMSSAAVDKDRITKVAAAAGDKSTGRGLAALNGMESMRGVGASAGAFASASAGASAGAGAGASAGASAGAGAVVAAGAGAQLQAAAGFQAAGGVSAGASAGFGMGASAGLSAGAGLGASVGVGMAAGMGVGIGGGISAGMGMGIGGGISAGAGIGFGASASFGASAGAAFGGMSAAGMGFGMGAAPGMGMGMTMGSATGGFGVTTSSSMTGFDGVTRSSTTTTTTGLDGVTRTTTSSSQTTGSTSWGSASVGIPASAGAFAGLGTSRTTLPGAGFNPDRLLPPPLPVSGANTVYDISGRSVSGNGQVAASYSARAGVIVW